MKNKILYTATILLASLAVIMLLGVGKGKGQEKKTPPVTTLDFVHSFCFDGKIDQMEIPDLVDMYTAKTNDYFNKNIEKIMTNPLEESPSPSLDDYPSKGNALCRGANGTEAADMTCQSIAVCNQSNVDKSNDPTVHPYCLAVTLLGVPPSNFPNYDWEKLQKIDQLKYSYFCYRAALDIKRDSLYDSTPQGIRDKCAAGSTDDICTLISQIDKETDLKKKADLEDQLQQQMNPRYWWSTAGRGVVTSMTATVVDISDSSGKRIKFIDDEEVRAKTALDQTLDAYSQLKTAWQLHVRYMDIFAELVKYRDHLVAIRKRTDFFPFRFIDATTTKCL